MSRLFVRFYVFIVLVLLGLGWLVEQLWWQWNAPDAEPSIPPAIELLHQEWMSRAPQEHLIQAYSGPGKLEWIARDSVAWLPQQATRLEQEQIVVLYDNLDNALYYLPLSEGVLVLGPLPLSPMSNSTPQRIYHSALFFILLAVAVGLWLRPIWRDLDKIRAASDAFSGDEQGFNVHLSTSSPIAPIANAFNTMAARIKRLLQAQKELAHAVSHELRTPLSRIKFALAMSDQNETTMGIQQDIAELERLIEEMLSYARLELAEIDLHPSQLDLSELLHHLCERVRQGTLITLRLDIPSNISLFGDGHFIERAVQNIVVNALKYADKEVNVSYESAAGWQCLHIDDDGPGIPLEDSDKVWQPFVRLDKSRDKQTGGSGLGMAIVDKIMKWHQGQAEIGVSPMGGARVSLKFPVRKPTPSAPSLHFSNTSAAD